MLIQTNFIAGKMNKSVDERLVPVGEYVDAMNVRLGSTETTEIGAVENSKGNLQLTTIGYGGNPLSKAARCIGAYEDGMTETIYWFITDPNNISSASGKVDMVLSYNTNTNSLIYHIVSETVLNFNQTYLITGVDKISDYLYWTDDINPPRYINITRNYNDDTAAVNPLIEEDISVIVKPPGFESDNLAAGTEPLGAPHLELVNNGSTEDYLEMRFLCFAYRYRYQDGGYSATSLFTNPAFSPKEFKFNLENYQNDGMVNRYNQATITFSSGSRRVTEIQLLYKESSNNNIYVINRLNKADLGMANNTFYNRTFTNSKILTLLGSDEILRLYDNVPRFAKAQTIQGNRLIYGNYVDQYDIVPKEGGTTIPMEYQATPVSLGLSGDDLGDPTTASATWTIDPAGGETLVDGEISFDCSGLLTSGSQIDAGTQLVFYLGMQNVKVVDRSPVLPGADFNGTPIDDFEVALNFVCPVPYATVNDLLTSSEFAAAVGTTAGMQQILPPSSGCTSINSGASLTDRFNFSICGSNGVISGAGNTLFLYNTSISGQCPPAPILPVPAIPTDPPNGTCAQQPFSFSVAGSTVTFQAPAAQYYFIDGASVVTNQFNYFAFNAPESSAAFSTIPNRLSLHSDRDYAVGVVYMDDYGRASTVLTTQNNTVYFPASAMTTKNKVEVTLENLAPYWATKYKFVMKPSQGNYNTIYSNIVYQQDGTGDAGSDPAGGVPNPAGNLNVADLSSFWFRLDGDSQNLVGVGDLLTVKTDAVGATNARLTCEVLDKEAMYSRQITNTSLPGTYIRLKPNGWQAIDPTGTANIDCKKTGTNDDKNSCGPTLKCGINDGGTAAAIPAGSSLFVRVRNSRETGSETAKCNTVEIDWEARLTASADYANIHDMLIGEQFVNYVNGDAAIINIGPLGLEFDTNLYTPTTTPTCAPFYGYIFVQEDSVTGEQFLCMDGNIPMCRKGLSKKEAKFKFDVELSFSPGIFCFESETQEVDPNLFYDASDLLDLTEIGGFKYHNATTVFDPATQQESITGGCVTGNCQNQTPTQPLMTTLDFGTCYVFGNGVESFRIEDRIDGKFFLLGERVVAVSNQDFKEADRFAGMTYSGVFSDSANSNNLNEFNLGLVNFKDLETSFGPIMKMHSRETDILILQEDRISYVLSGKNVITDSTGGGAITSVPEVLGTQVARIEEYGISFNPESFTSWGHNMYFTDTKRGAVLMLQGASANSDQLTTISSFGMRSWFRDQFNAELTTQKLGGYDPYMNEYVLSTNDQPVPIPLTKLPCNQTVTQEKKSDDLTYEVDLGTIIGAIQIPYTISAGTINITVNWNGVDYSPPGNPVNTSGSFSFNKTSATPSKAIVTIVPVGGYATYGVTIKCPPETPLTLVQVVVNTTNYFGEGIHTEFAWDDGTTFSPTQSNGISLNNSTPTSSYIAQTGIRSDGMFPYDGASVTLRTRKIAPDTFDFNPLLHRFKILSSNTLYTDTTADIDALLGLASNITPITTPTPPVHQAEAVGTIQGGTFNMAAGNQYLYLIWDFRDITCAQLCYSNTDYAEVCCDCSTDCNVCWFSPVQANSLSACLVNTDSFGAAQYSFNGSNIIPELGDICWADPGLVCDNTSGFLPVGYYIVDPSQPSAASPKNWIQVGASGVVIQTGTC
jgi:hypothetical protein